MNTPPFKAEVVVSLLRPQSILDARAARAQGRAGDDDVWAVEARSIKASAAPSKDACGDADDQ